MLYAFVLLDNYESTCLIYGYSNQLFLRQRLQTENLSSKDFDTII